MSPRLYSLFYRPRVGTSRWTRVPGAGTYFRETAIRVFQNRLINGAFDTEFEWRLRVVKTETEALRMARELMEGI